MEYGDERTPVVRIIARGEDGKIIVVRKKDIGKWELPGGKIEEDEDRFEAAKRELMEETGLEAGELVDLARVEIEDENGCANAYIMFTDEVSGSVSISSGEHDRYRWVEKEKYTELDFHYHSAYSVPSVRRLETYLENRDF